MYIDHVTTFTVTMTEQEASDIISNIDDMYDKLLQDYHTPDEISSLLALKNGLVTELQR